MQPRRAPPPQRHAARTGCCAATAAALLCRCRRRAGAGVATGKEGRRGDGAAAAGEARVAGVPDAEQAHRRPPQVQRRHPPEVPRFHHRPCAGTAPLPWSIRLKIALGAAKGLAFLHEETERPVIFRDLKTSNVLLDAEFNAKLSDFGLARDGPEGDKTHVSTRVMGTYGYAAPEYVMTGHLTSKSDVYSFGVVLLELMTGRKSMDKNRPNGDRNLVEWARPYLKDRLKLYRMIDPKLGGNYSLKGAHRLAQMAHACLTRNPKARPLMSKVVEALEPLPNLKDMAATSNLFQAQAERAGSSRLASPNGSHSMKAQSSSAQNGQQAVRSLSYGPPFRSAFHASPFCAAPHAPPYRQSPRPSAK